MSLTDDMPEPIQLPMYFLADADRSVRVGPGAPRSGSEQVKREYRSAVGHSYSWGFVIESRVMIDEYQEGTALHFVPTQIWIDSEFDRRGDNVPLENWVMMMRALARSAIGRLERGVALADAQHATLPRYRHELFTLLLLPATDFATREWLEREFIPQSLPFLLTHVKSKIARLTNNTRDHGWLVRERPQAVDRVLATAGR